MSDEGAAQVLQAVIVATMVFGAVTYVTYNSSHQPQGVNVKDAYENKEKQTEQIVVVGEHWCCPLDPSASSMLQDRAMQAWAGKPAPLVDTFEPWFPSPEATEYAVKASWAPRGDRATHTVDIFRTDDPDGKTAGTQMATRPAKQGPAYVIPRLDKFSAESSADLLTLPVDNVWPYQEDPFGAHQDHVQTTITYERSYPDTSDTRTVTMRAHSEITGAPNPAVDLYFEEPDWQELEVDMPRLKIGDGNLERAFTQVLTKDDLSSEKTLHQDDLIEGSENLTEGVYPQHPFQLQARIHGPGSIEAASKNTATPGETRELTDAYKLTLEIPRNWTDVDTTTNDTEANLNHSWNNTSIEELDAGGWRITSYLNVTAEFDVTERGPRWILTNATEIRAPFRFHARPPDDDASTELGFHDLQATLESQRFGARETADLTVEVATSPGRVHRTLQTHTPEVVPDTNTTDGDPEGVDLVLGAVLKNGGEATNITRIQWTLPQHTNLTRDPTKLEDFTGKGRFSIDETDERLTVTWTVDESLSDATCGELEACPVAARLTLDGGGLTQRSLWAQPQLVSLYDQEDAQPFLDWFVRSQKAWEGVRDDEDYPPDFALAHRYRHVDAGPTEGAYRFTVPPTRTPVCDEDDIDHRNEADRSQRDGRVHYDFGPREDGLPHVSRDQTELLDTELTCSIGDRNFTVVGKMGLRGTTDAIGKNTYRSVPGLSGQVVADWQNGMAESRVTAPDEVNVGQNATITVKVSSLMTTLFLDDGVTDVTIERMVFDPYNAWEAQPWHQDWIWRPGSDTDANTDEPIESTDGERSGQDLTGSNDEELCANTDTECITVDHRKAPAELERELHVPEDAVPGTHLLVVEVHWTFTTAEGNDITETGRLVEPFDVTVDDAHVQGAAIGVTAWDTDWR